VFANTTSIENEITIVVFYSFIYRDHFAEGLRLKNLNRFEEALVANDLALKHNPTDSSAFNCKGVCLSKLNHLDEALAGYDMAIKHDTTNSEAYNNRGTCLKQLNRHDEALSAYAMAIKHDPTY
jgi:tetratricopeptide (TPR) repeat protein